MFKITCPRSITFYCAYAQSSPQFAALTKPAATTSLGDPDPEPSRPKSREERCNVPSPRAASHRWFGMARNMEEHGQASLAVIRWYDAIGPRELNIRSLPQNTIRIKSPNYHLVNMPKTVENHCLEQVIQLLTSHLSIAIWTKAKGVCIIIPLFNSIIIPISSL